MKLDVPYKFLDLTPDDELVNFNFDTITSADWAKNTSLKTNLPRIFGELEIFRIIFLDSADWNSPENVPMMDNTEHPIHALILKELAKLEQYYNSSAKIAVLDRMPPGSKIYKHFDQSAIYEQCHRIHLPLVTDPAVDFFIDDVKYHFKKGQYFEFNNRAFHEVHNNSDKFRIHLVVDLLPN